MAGKTSRRARGFKCKYFQRGGKRNSILQCSRQKSKLKPSQMTVPFSYTQSPFLFHHVPNSPFLLSTSRPATQSPIPLVPDVELARNNNYSSNNVLRNGTFLSPTPVVPSNSNPTTPQATPTRINASSDSQREQVVPHFSPMMENKSLNRKERRLDMSPKQGTVPEINLFSGEEIFA